MRKAKEKPNKKVHLKELKKVTGKAGYRKMIHYQPETNNLPFFFALLLSFNPQNLPF
jgi:hypothetical protein